MQELEIHPILGAETLLRLHAFSTTAVRKLLTGCKRLRFHRLDQVRLPAAKTMLAIRVTSLP